MVLGLHRGDCQAWVCELSEHLPDTESWPKVLLMGSTHTQSDAARPLGACRLLVVDDEPNIRKTLTLTLEAEGHSVTAVSNAQDALAEASRRSFDVALVDIRLGAASGLDLVPALLASSPWLKVIMITAFASIDTAVEAMKRGAFDYLPKPFTPDQLSMVLARAGELRSLEQRIGALQEALAETAPEVDFATHSPPMERALAMARQVAESDATVLLRGESGTGKSLLARAIHGWSRRAAKPFSVVSCPSLSRELLESELFGHVQGAFTGALRDQSGRIAATEGGTLLLDEIGDLPLALQPKLLRFLQERAYERVGDVATRRADVRVLAATNQPLEEAVAARTFREDLFYRLNVVQITVPPLRERREDIVALAERLLAFFAVRSHRRALTLGDATREALMAHGWPGNVRELRNAMERAALLATGDQVGAEHLPFAASPSGDSTNVGDLVSLEQIEEQHIRRVLAATRSIDEAANVLGMDTVTLWRRRKKYGI